MDKEIALASAFLMLFACLCIGGGNTPQTTTASTESIASTQPAAEPSTLAPVPSTEPVPETVNMPPVSSSPETTEEVPVVTTEAPAASTMPRPPATTTTAPTLENCDKCTDGTLCEGTNKEGKMCLCNYPQDGGTYRTCVLDRPLIM